MTNQQRKYWKERIEQKARDLQQEASSGVTDEDADARLRDVNVEGLCGGDEMSVRYAVEQMEEAAQRAETLKHHIVMACECAGIEVSEYNIREKSAVRTMSYLLDRVKRAILNDDNETTPKERIAAARDQMIEDLMAGDFPEDPREMIENRFQKAVEGDQE
jgi:hypothetical protein